MPGRRGLKTSRAISMAANATCELWAFPAWAPHLRQGCPRSERQRPHTSPWGGRVLATKPEPGWRCSGGFQAGSILGPQGGESWPVVILMSLL